MNENEFSDFVKYMRKAAGLSTKQLAKRIGCSKSTICNYESNTRIPKDTTEFEFRLRAIVKEEIKRKREEEYEGAC
jgi:ribosome-binding protein aMBF1 (putative translation factor)